MPRYIFQNTIKMNDKNISLAIDSIPLEGDVTESHYERFIMYFRKAFPDFQELSGATRLLAMKRPDVFVCFNSKNRKKLCNDFGIKPSNMDYKRYWDDIIERIFDSEWWKSPKPENKPENKIEIGIWENRSAFLDALYYE